MPNTAKTVICDPSRHLNEKRVSLKYSLNTMTIKVYGFSKLKEITRCTPCFIKQVHHKIFLCRLRSIATHRDHFVRRLSVRLSHFSDTLSRAMFRRQHMHSSECCHYILNKKMHMYCTIIIDKTPYGH